MTPFSFAASAVVVLLLFGAWFRRVVVPRRPADAETPRPRRLTEGPAKPLETGLGVRIVVNPGAGPALRRAPTQALLEGLPEAEIVELQEGDDMEALLRAPGATAIGASGGDGTLATAANIAVGQESLFVAVPGGTLNHFARDLGLATVDDAIEAVRSGYAASIDVGCVADRIFLNTMSFGGYSAVVDTRERLESRIGKWPALLVALVGELPRMRPLRVRVDGTLRRVWLAWIGNCAYSPAGLAPAWRESLEDGLLDVRIVDGARRFSRTRFALAALSGRLDRCRVYSAKQVESLEVECFDGPVRLATDGETWDGPAEFTVSKRRRALRVALPPPD